MTPVLVAKGGCSSAAQSRWEHRWDEVECFWSSCERERSCRPTQPGLQETEVVGSIKQGGLLCGLRIPHLGTNESHQFPGPSRMDPRQSASSPSPLHPATGAAPQEATDAIAPVGQERSEFHFT